VAKIFNSNLRTKCVSKLILHDLKAFQKLYTQQYGRFLISISLQPNCKSLIENKIFDKMVKLRLFDLSKLIYIYTLLVCLFVSKNLQNDSTYRAQIFEGLHMSPGKVYG